MKTRTFAVVSVTISVEVPDAWGPDCTVAQVRRQATDSALGIVRRLVDEQRGVSISGTDVLRIWIQDEAGS